MFIALNSVKAKNSIIGENILIFDTSDLSLEYVNYASLKEQLLYQGTSYFDEGSNEHMSVASYIGDERVVGFVGSVYIYNNSALDAAMITFGTKDRYGKITVGKLLRYSLTKWKFGDYLLRVCIDSNNRFCIGDQDLFDCNELSEYILHFNPTLHYAYIYKGLLIARWSMFVERDALTTVTDLHGNAKLVYNNKGILFGDKALYIKLETTMQY